MSREPEQSIKHEIFHPALLPDDALISTAQLAQWLGRTVGHLEVCRSQGRGFPFVRLPDGGIRYRVGVIRRMLAELDEYFGTHQYPTRAKPGPGRPAGRARRTEGA
jgi:hypothetical protein